MSVEAPHPVRDLDDVVHQRVRLGILSILSESSRADFGHLQRTLEVTAGNLSQHLRVLAESGLVEIEKVIEGNRPRTWVSATREGRRALKAEVTALRGLLRRLGA